MPRSENPPSDDAPTPYLPAARHATTPASREQGRFFPGAQLTERYRIVELIGRGGMGEVVRAEDLKLGQPVALKLLPEEVQDDPERLERFLGEVRAARQVSHPNVCRVHDVGEASGLHFLSMEYVDGEDLASLLRRIGRLPQDKAIEIARQMCAGLAAVHDQGLLHRDLKPANVMIDGRGRVRITDFGLATLAGETRGRDVASGTPAYMAPEQLAGSAVSIRSEIYALGLVLYELCTGRAPFPAATSMSELKAQRESATPASPASLVEGLDPTVERVILSCLEHDPADRPRSVREVAAALPGGDPLAAALAAGETPSPELVAAAAEASGLRPAVALAGLLGLVLALALVILAAPHTQLTSMVPLDKPPSVLIEKAKEIVRVAGYTETPRDRTFAFSYAESYLAYLESEDSSPRRWDALASERPHPIQFWYRQSPRLLVRYDLQTLRSSYFDPPPLISGMVGVHLDAQGRLKRFDAVPPEVDEEARSATGFDWSALFAEAELDLVAFEPIEPTWTPLSYADTRVAWRGDYPGRRGTPIEVQAAAYRGRPVSFRIIEPWTTPTRQQPAAVGSSMARAISVLFFVGSVLGAGTLARRNLGLGRSDRSTANRLAVFLLSIQVLKWLVGAHHVAEPGDQVSIFAGQLSFGLYLSSLVWVCYVALEPYLRRLWPRVLASWIRLLRGRVRDPSVGRDILLACCFGSAMVLLRRLGQLVPAQLGQPPLRPDFAARWFDTGFWEIAVLVGPRHHLATVLELLGIVLIYNFIGITSILLFRLLLRRTWLAVAAFLVFSVGFFSPPVDLPSAWLTTAVIIGLSAVFLFRYGFLAWVVATFVDGLLRGLPTTLDPANICFEGSLLSLGIVLGLAAYGFHVSLAGRPLFRDEVFAAES